MSIPPLGSLYKLAIQYIAWYAFIYILGKPLRAWAERLIASAFNYPL